MGDVVLFDILNGGGVAPLILASALQVSDEKVDSWQVNTVLGLLRCAIEKDTLRTFLTGAFCWCGRLALYQFATNIRAALIKTASSITKSW